MCTQEIKDSGESVQVEGAQECNSPSSDVFPVGFPSTVEADFDDLNISAMAETPSNSCHEGQLLLPDPLSSISLSEESYSFANIKIYDLAGGSKSNEDNISFGSKELNEESSLDEDISVEEESIEKSIYSESSGDETSAARCRNTDIPMGDEEDNVQNVCQDDTPILKSQLSTPTAMEGGSGKGAQTAQDPTTRISHLICFCCPPTDENQYPKIGCKMICSRALLTVSIIVAIIALATLIISLTLD